MSEGGGQVQRQAIPSSHGDSLSLLLVRCSKRKSQLVCNLLMLFRDILDIFDIVNSWPVDKICPIAISYHRRKLHLLVPKITIAIFWCVLKCFLGAHKQLSVYTGKVHNSTLDPRFPLCTCSRLRADVNKLIISISTCAL